MKQFVLKITLLSILTIFPFAILAQSSDDADGDGIPNSEDACPNTAGTIANKGCPGKDDPIAIPTPLPNPKSTPQTSPNKTPDQLSPDLQGDLRRLNQLLKTLDGGSTPFAKIIDGTIYFRKKDGSSRSLKLNEISKVGFLFEYSDVNWVALICKNGAKCVNYIDGTGTRASDDSFTIHALNGFETTELYSLLNNVVSHSQPNSSSVAKKAGSLSDCKLILSEGCRNFLLNSTIDELRSPLRLEKRSENVYGSYDRFEVTVDPSSGVVIEIKIYKKSGWKPNNDIKWGEGMTKVQEKLADAVTYSSSYFGSLHLNDVEMKFYDGDLGSISLTRARTATEELANYVRYYEKKNGELAIARSREEAEARKPPSKKHKKLPTQKHERKEKWNLITNRCSTDSI